MSIGSVKGEMRLFAIEYLLCDLWTKYYRLIGASQEQIEAAHKKAIEGLKNESFPNMDAALSDLSAAELEDAVTDLLAMQQQMWPAPGSTDTELSVLMEPEVCHGETEVYPRV